MKNNSLSNELLNIEIQYNSKMVADFYNAFDEYTFMIVANYLSNAGFIDQIFVQMCNPETYKNPPVEIIKGILEIHDSKLEENLAEQFHLKNFTINDLEKYYPFGYNYQNTEQSLTIPIDFYKNHLKAAILNSSDFIASHLLETMQNVRDHNVICRFFENGIVSQYVVEQIRQSGTEITTDELRNIFWYSRLLRNIYIHHNTNSEFPGFNKKWIRTFGTNKSTLMDFEWNYGMNKINRVLVKTAITPELQAALKKYENSIDTLLRKTKYKPIKVSDIISDINDMPYLLHAAKKTEGTFVYNDEYFFYDNESEIKREIEKDKYFDTLETHKTSVALLASTHDISENEVLNILKVKNHDGYVFINENVANGAIVEYLSKQSKKNLNNNISPLRDLLKYSGGVLSENMILELLKTHKVILDISLFEDKSGINFLENTIIKNIVVLKRTNVITNVIVTKNTKYRLYQEFEREDNKLGFIVLRDYLEKSKIVNIEGEVDTEETKIQSIEKILSNNINQRTAILMTGNLSWVKKLNRNYYPYLTVCRYIAANNGLYVVKDWYPFKNNYDDSEDNEEIQVLEKKTNSEKTVDRLKSPTVSKHQLERTEKWRKSKKKTTKQNSPIIKGGIAPSSFPFLAHTDDNEGIWIYSPLLEKGTVAEGGEGTIYITDQKDVVAKLYHNSEKAEENYQKLYEMCAVKLDIPEVCWPKHLIFNDKNEFIGYSMKQVPEGKSTLKASIWNLHNRNIIATYPNWNRLSSVKLCEKIASVFAELHKNNILMGDVNAGNIMIDPDNPESVYFVDCDSYQFKDYLCTVGNEEFSSQDYLDRATKNGIVEFGSIPRNVKDEDYSIAYVLFHIMMQVSPLYLIDMDEQTNAKRNHRFSFEDNPPPQGLVTSTEYVMWRNMTKQVRNRFINTFMNNIDVTAGSYADAFKNYAYAMVKFSQPLDLFPTLFIDYTDDHSGTIDCKCKRCGKTFNVINNAGNREKIKNGDFKYCRSCMDLMNAYHEITKTYTCPRCKKQFTATMYDEETSKMYHRTMLCPDCREAIRKHKGNRYQTNLKR